MRPTLVHECKLFLGNLYAFLIQAQGFHWNIEGRDFFTLHAFFEEVYTSLQEDIDTLAERIRFLGDYPPSSLRKLNAIATLEDFQEDHLNTLKRVEIFLQNAHIIATHGYKIMTVCDQHKDLVTQDFFVQHIAKLEKAMWKARMYQTNQSAVMASDT